MKKIVTWIVVLAVVGGGGFKLKTMGESHHQKYLLQTSLVEKCKDKQESLHYSVAANTLSQSEALLTSVSPVQYGGLLTRSKLLSDQSLGFRRSSDTWERLYWDIEEQVVKAILKKLYPTEEQEYHLRHSDYQDEGFRIYHASEAVHQIGNVRGVARDLFSKELTMRDWEGTMEELKAREKEVEALLERADKIEIEFEDSIKTYNWSHVYTRGKQA